MSSSISKLRLKYGRGDVPKKNQHSQNTIKKICISKIEKKDHDELNGLTVNIVGAGFAGLFCGWILGNAGFDVNIYEATDQLGGRVRTQQNDNRLIEEGGELIGLCHPLWLHLARHFGLSLSVVIPEQDYEGSGLDIPIVIDGVTLSNEEVQKAESSLDEILMKISEDAKKIKYPSQPWRENDEIKKLDLISVADKLDEFKFEGHGRKLFELQQESDNGSLCSEQSYLGLLCQVKVRENFDPKNFWDTIEVFRCSNGNQALAHALAKGKNVKVHTNTVCTGISYNETLKKMEIKTSSGTSISHFTILTIPPTTFDNITFNPKIDLNKYNVSMGISRKVISEVDSRFWISENLSPNGLSTNFGNVWETTENQTILSETEQNIYLSSFLVDPIVLKNFDAEYSKKMDVIFRDKYSKHLISKKLIDWPTEIYTKCGYSYAGIGVSTTNGKNLYYPLEEYNNKLYFAGEHTHMSLYGYMEGALESGLRAAKQIIESCAHDKSLKNQNILELIDYIDSDKD
ncbi:MAG: hypothetical protein Edafosvirus10_38 [Edafosvirus sp.]|uniref:Amine oxidase domain-containing protein n=1 Tax=Edafosvirus sp. TaxID=2487765 RepID=A0A3G4ZXP1_9VIRU|nr:MAG: hypothetical protein Edafosvirus10_38 [Edafosvirus sp.]